MKKLQENSLCLFLEQTPLFNFPPEIWLLIVRFLPENIRELTKLGEVCQYLHSFLHYNALWALMIHKIHPEIHILPSIHNYRQLFSIIYDINRLQKRILAPRKTHPFASDHAQVHYYNFDILGSNRHIDALAWGMDRFLYSKEGMQRSIAGHAAIPKFSDYSILGEWNNTLLHPVRHKHILYSKTPDILFFLPTTSDEFLALIKEAIAKHNEPFRLQFYCLCFEGQEQQKNMEALANMLSIPCFTIACSDLPDPWGCDTRPESPGENTVSRMLDRITVELARKRKEDDEKQKSFDNIPILKRSIQQLQNQPLITRQMPFFRSKHPYYTLNLVCSNKKISFQCIDILSRHLCYKTPGIGSWRNTFIHLTQNHRNDASFLNHAPDIILFFPESPEELHAFAKSRICAHNHNVGLRLYCILLRENPDIQSKAEALDLCCLSISENGFLLENPALHLLEKILQELFSVSDSLQCN